MSVVVAIKTNGRVYLGADSQVTKGGTRQSLKNPNNYKIWHVRGSQNCMMAHVGDIREANIARLIDGLVDDYDMYKNNIDYEFVVKVVVPTLVKELRKVGYIKDEPYFEGFNSSFLFAYQDQLFSISGDGCVIEIEDFVSIGSGYCEATGSLLTSEGESPERRIVKAIKASAASDIYVDYPIILTNTKDEQFKIVTENNEEGFLKSCKRRAD